MASARSVVYALIFAIMGQSRATVIQNEFSLLEEGDSIVGELFATILTRSSLHCSIR